MDHLEDGNSFLRVGLGHSAEWFPVSCASVRNMSDPLLGRQLVSKLPGCLHSVFGELGELRDDTGKQGTAICHALCP